MSRVKRGVMTHKRHKKVMEQAKGYRGSRSRHFKVAHETVMRALWFAYVDRRKRKRDFRKLWIIRINAAARINGMSYSTFMNGLKRAGIEIDRKQLANLAVYDAEAFTAIAKQAQQALSA